MMGPRTDGTISTNGYKSIQNGELKTHEAILLWKWKSMEILPAFIKKKNKSTRSALMMWIDGQDQCTRVLMSAK